MTELPLELAFHNMDHSAAVENFVREKLSKLEPFADDIIDLHLTLDRPQGRRGGTYSARLLISVPGEKLKVDRHPGESARHRDLWVTINDAIEAAERQLRDYRQRRKDKRHSGGPRELNRQQAAPGAAGDTETGGWASAAR